MDYRELQSDRRLLNYVFDTYISFRPFLKGMNITLESCYPHREPEVWKQYPYGLDIDPPENNLGVEADEALG